MLCLFLFLIFNQFKTYLKDYQWKNDDLYYLQKTIVFFYKAIELS